ncbi:MAG: tRNA glutamyl-Q(34) synthetase GluQRS [Hyphomicrobiales bacterium]|nr:MAG: tRNA glutamyl-Q(34) synthetase GluQRS [Hyphomicrobiales bacterium]
MSQPKSQPIFRFAPSPNGKLHLGHAYSALLNQKLAREAGGKLLLRIEDIDTVRCTPELETQMLDDLKWLGIEWDEKPMRQSENFETYANALKKLQAAGLVYPGFMSRGEVTKIVNEAKKAGTIWPRDPDGTPHYPPNDKNMNKNQRAEMLGSSAPNSYRLDMSKALETIVPPLQWHEKDMHIEADPKAWGDVVLARRDIPTSYHLACVLDDADQNITHIVRGNDLYSATAIHRLLQELLDLEAPRYHHHKLILDEDGQKLSKSRKDTSLSDLREQGKSPNDIKILIGFS